MPLVPGQVSGRCHRRSRGSGSQWGGSENPSECALGTPAKYVCPGPRKTRCFSIKSNYWRMDEITQIILKKNRKKRIITSKNCPEILL